MNPACALRHWALMFNTSGVGCPAPYQSPLPLAGEVAVSAAGEGEPCLFDDAFFRVRALPLTRAYSPTSPPKRGEVTWFFFYPLASAYPLAVFWSINLSA